MKIVALQVDTVWENKAATHDRVEALLESVDAGSLVVLPEMFATGFSIDLPTVIDDPREGVTHAFLRALAVRHHCYVIGGVVVPAPGGRGWNQAIGFGPNGESVVRYTKVHPFTYGGEGQVIDAGVEPVLFDIDGIRVCPLICYDLRFPELFRWGVRRGAELFPVIANWPAQRHDHWRTLSRARAIENQACVVAVNRCGRDPNLAYAGGSAIVDPRGVTLAEAGRDEEMLTAEIEAGDIRACRAEFPALRDMRDHFFPSPGT